MATPAPYLTPGQRPWRRRGEVVPPVLGARQVPTSTLGPKAPVGLQSPVDTSMWLNLEGAAGTKIAIHNLDKGRSDLFIDGDRVKRENNGDFKVPMEQGQPQKLYVRSRVPGYPTIKFRDKTVYKSPKPPIMYAIAYFSVLIGALIVVASFGGVAMAGIATMAAGYVAPSLMVKAKGKQIQQVGLLVVGVAFAVFGVAHAVS